MQMQIPFYGDRVDDVVVGLRKSAANHLAMLDECGPRWEAWADLAGLRSFLDGQTYSKPLAYRDPTWLNELAIECWLASGRNMSSQKRYHCDDCPHTEIKQPSVVKTRCHKCTGRMYAS
jgi:hypothetical protein